MYVGLWRILPGPKLIKLLQLLVLLAGVVLLLFMYVYPYANEALHLTGNTVG